MIYYLFSLTRVSRTTKADTHNAQQYIPRPSFSDELFLGCARLLEIRKGTLASGAVVYGLRSAEPWRGKAVTAGAGVGGPLRVALR
jgi:hypothetical protein